MIMRSYIFFVLLCVTVTASSSSKLLRTRSLAKTTVPFSIRLNLAVSKNDKRPLASDYDGVEVAVTSWFNAQSKMYYGASYSSTDCDLDRNGLYFWNSASGIAMPHTISLKCNSAFNGDSGIPTSNQLMSTASKHYSYGLFVADYLLPTLSDNSVFQNTNRVSIGMTGQAAGSGATNNVNPVVAPSSGTAPAPTFRPTFRPTLPPTLAAPASGDVSIVPAILKWTIGKSAYAGVAPTKPTNAEYEEFLALSHSFVMTTLGAAYASSSTPRLLGGESSFRSKDYNAATATPYTMVIVTNLRFNSATPPPMWQWVGPLRSAGLEGLRADYLPDSGPFMTPATMQWLALDN